MRDIVEEGSNGFLCELSPALALFLVLLGCMVERGSVSLRFRREPWFFAGAVAGFYDPHFGMGAAMLLCCAIRDFYDLLWGIGV